MHATNLEAPAAGAAPDRQGQYLTFALGEETYAVGILAIKEIIEFGGLTRVPMMPGAFCGVINLRGAAVPVVDLGACFGRTAATLSKRSCIVIVEVHAQGRSQVIGLLVDAVDEVIEFGAGAIEPAPRLGGTDAASPIAGIAKANGGFVIVVDVDAILSLGGAAAITAC